MASEWLIIGGGIHGMHLALQLTQRGGVKPAQIRIVDPHPTPLAVWNRVTRAVGMEFLRSPTVHNLHWDQGSLGLYARIHQHEPMTRFIPPFARPSLDLFNAHNAHLIRKFGLDTLRIQARAEKLARLPDCWRVETDHGALDAKHVVIAIGLSEQPYWPEWAQPYRGSSAVQHIFEPDFDRASLPDWDSLIVVGGGITAAQITLALAQHNPGNVTLIRRHDERVFDFDSDVGWMNAINLRGFALINDWDERRRVIKQARHRGSMPPDVKHALNAAVAAGAVTLINGEPRSLSRDQSLTVTLQNGETHSASQIVLATGYRQTRPGGLLTESAIADYGLPTASDGYPILTPSLAWAPGLHVSGPLAELEIGPPARNIIGARLAGQRLVNV